MRTQRGRRRDDDGDSVGRTLALSIALSLTDGPFTYKRDHEH